MLEVTRKFPGPSDLSWKSKTSAIKEQTDGREKTEQLKPFQELTGGKSVPSVSEQYKDIKSDIENPFKSLKKDKNLDALVGDFIDSNKPHEESSISSKPQKPSSDVTTQQPPLPDISTAGRPDEGEKPPAGAANITGQTGPEPSTGEGSARQTQVSQTSAPSEPGTGRQQENSQRITGTEEKPPETSSAAIRRPAGMAQRAGRTEQT